MKKNYLFVAVAILATMFASCRKEQGSYSITANLHQQDVWTAGTKLDTGGDMDAYMGMYVFDNSDAYVCFTALKMATASNFAVNTTRITNTGHYTIYGFTGLVSAGIPRPTDGTITLNTLLTVEGMRDVCLGTQTLDVVRSQQTYTTTITVNHIMAQLALTISGVPADVDQLVVTLPNQANQFNFLGQFSGNTTSVELPLTRSATAGADGLYSWTLNETIIYPCANGTTTMPIVVEGDDAAGRHYTFNTSSSTCCTTGTRTVLTSTWNILNYYLEAGFTVNPWTTVVQNGSFGLGDPVIN